MTQSSYHLSLAKFNKLFPFYILIDREGIIKSCGSSLSKIGNIIPGTLFSNKFVINRPTVVSYDFKSLSDLQDTLVIIELADNKLSLRGQFEHNQEDELMFIGSPWFSSMKEVAENNLGLEDFAIHDPVIDLLYALKTQEIAIDEVKGILTKVNHQRDTLHNDQIELAVRENMLRSIALATDELLSNDNFFDAIAKCLPILGEAVKVDRVYLFENGVADNKLITSQRLEWNSGVVAPQINNPDLQNLPLELFEEFIVCLSQKEPFNAIVRELPDGSIIKDALAVQDIKSILIFPIFHKETFWGFVGYDDCTIERIWKDAEITILKSFSSSIAHAIQRSETSREIYNMALFALESPDPLIRISLKGDVLLRNKASEEIEYFISDENKFNDVGFFSHLTKTLSESNRILTGEAWRQGKTYLVIARLSDSREHINIYLSDITEKRKAELLLKESERRISTLIKNLRTGVLLEDENRRIVVTNENFCAMFHIPVPPEILVGADCSDAAELNKNLFVMEEKFKQDIEMILRAKRMVMSEELELKNGCTYERSYIPIYVDDVYKGHLWTYDDITARKNYERTLKIQEEKYRSITVNMNLGLVEVDLDDRIMYVNQSFCEISGYSAEELIGKSASGIFVLDGSNVILEKNELRHKGISDSYELRVKNKTGEIRWWLVSGAPNYNDKGEIIGSIGIHLDITNQKALEEELLVAKERAEESSTAKESFLANMSHEIRTPLNAIIGMVRELTKTSLDSNQKIFLKHAGSASQHLLSILNNILDVSKIEAGEFQLDCRPFSLSSVFHEVEAIMAPSAKEKMLDLEFHITDKIAPLLRGDSNRIRQIMINIVSNAIKFTIRGSVVVKCNSVWRNDRRQEIRISITDTGIGMDPAYLKNIFKKFTQEDVSIQRSYGGTGLGMAITNELIQRMDGRIDVVSEKGSGTTFTITLTLNIENEEALKDTGFRKSPDSFRNARVLLVEDNELNRLVVTNSLLHFDVKVLEARNGADAVEILAKESFDLILMDLQMPVMDGMEATRIIRDKLGLKTPIIALTANAFKKDIDRCMAIGMNDCVTKPFEEKSLIDTISRNIYPATRNTHYLNEDESRVVEAEPAGKLYDLTEITLLSRGNNEFVKKMLTIFLGQARLALVTLQESFEKNDISSIKAVSHKIKPALGNLRIDSIKSDILCLEGLNPSDADWASIRKIILKIEQVLNCVITGLENELSLM